MKTTAPIWPVALILFAALLFGLSSFFEPDQMILGEEWVIGLALGLLVIKTIVTLHIGRKPNPAADTARLRRNIERGLRDKT